MILLYTTTDMLTSKLIRWGTKSKVSHFAVCDSMRPMELDSHVLDSTLSRGVSVSRFETFGCHNRIIAAFEVLDLDPDKSRELFMNIREKTWGLRYDTAGVAYLAYASVWYVKLLGKELPQRNRWANGKQYFCSEVFNHLKPLFPHNPLWHNRGAQNITPDFALRLVKSEPARFKDITREVQNVLTRQAKCVSTA